MNFDRLCGIVEKHFPDRDDPWDMQTSLKETLEDAKIFEVYDEVPTIKEDTYFKYAIPENIEFTTRTFFLPFRTVAVERKGAGMCILRDKTENQNGLMKERIWTTFYDLNNLLLKESKFEREDIYNHYRTTFNVDYRDCYWITIGNGTAELIPFKDGGRFSPKFIVTHFFLCTEGEILMAETYKEARDDYKKLLSVSSVDLSMAYGHMFQLNSRDLFVVEATPIRKQPPKNQRGKIIRSVDRPQYLVMSPVEIKKKIRQSGALLSDEPTRKLEFGHHRRKHFRILRHEKFSDEKKAEPIPVRACWVGPHEWEMGKKKYRVMIDT